MAPVPDTESECDDKPNECEDLSTPDLIIAPDPDIEDDDEEADSGPYQGYQPLSQDPADSNLTDSEENDNSDDNDITGPSEITSSATEEVAATGIPLGGLYPDFPNSNIPTYLQVPDLPKPDKKCLLWNQTKKEREIQMGQEQEAQVKAAMAGFQLPMSNIPDWAKNLTEDEWKEKLVSKISKDNVNDAENVNSGIDERDSERPHCSKNTLTLDTQQF